MNYSDISDTVIKTLKIYGSPAKVIHAAGGNSNAYAVFSKNKSTDSNNLVTFTHKTLIVSATKRPLAVGDFITISKREYSINDVEVIEQQNVVIAYKVGVDD